MRNLSDTIARLAAMRNRQGPLPTRPDDQLSDLVAFGSNPGALRARLYVPEGLPPEPALVVALHGCMQTGAGYDQGSGWSRLADQEKFAVLLPEQQRANNPNLCFNWFVPEGVSRDRGEVLSIRQMIEVVAKKHGVDRQRIFITGLSAGGAMAAAMLATYPEVFAGGAILAGLAYGSAATIPQAFDRMRGHAGPSKTGLQQRLSAASAHEGTWPKISIWHGTADNTVASSNADSIVAQWQGVHGVEASPTRKETVDGHTRRVWCDAEGNELIETNTIAGMGHGTPLKTSGEDGLGVAAPFMLDVGISSTRRIAGFWGLTDSSEPDGEKAARRLASGTALLPNSPTENARTGGVTQPGPAHRSGSAAGITKVIEDALRAAGLMR